MSLCAKYAYLEHRMFDQATVALDYLCQKIPAFIWPMYQADPGQYDFRSCSRLRGRGRGRRWQRTGCQSGRNQSASGDEAGGGGLYVKKLFFDLNWLRAEVFRVDCESQQLLNQRSTLTVKLSEENGLLSAAQCRPRTKSTGSKTSSRCLGNS